MGTQSLNTKHVRQIEQWLGIPLRFGITRGGWEHFAALVFPVEGKINLFVDRKEKKVIGFESSPIRVFEDWDLEIKMEWERLKTLLIAQGVYKGEDLTWRKTN